MKPRKKLLWCFVFIRNVWVSEWGSVVVLAAAQEAASPRYTRHFWTLHLALFLTSFLRTPLRTSPQHSHTKIAGTRAIRCDTHISATYPNSAILTEFYVENTNRNLCPDTRMNTNGRFGALVQLSLIGRHGMRAGCLLVTFSLVSFLGTGWFGTRGIYPSFHWLVPSHLKCGCWLDDSSSRGHYTKTLALRTKALLSPTLKATLQNGRVVHPIFVVHHSCRLFNKTA